MSLSFVGGVFVGSAVSVSNLYLYPAVAILTGIAGLTFYVGQPASQTASLTALFFLSAVFGMLRVNAALKLNEYESIFNSQLQLEGYIVEDVDVRPNRQLIIFQPKGFGQKILITATVSQEYFYGDWIVVQGKIREPKSYEDFDYKKYLERYDVYAVMAYPKILVLKIDQQNWLKFRLLKLKYAFASRVSKFLPTPQSSLLLGILVGARRALPQGVQEDFQRTGTSHIVAVSGFNITIIIAALAGLARLVGRRLSFIFSLLIIAAFVVISGASASVLRAALMGGLVLWSLNVGRLYAAGPALCLAALLMLLINPKILYWDVGFQLSFAATLGIVYLVPLFEKMTARWSFSFLKEILTATIAATLATLPLVLWHFGRLSLVALVVNVLVLPVVPYAMLFGFLTGVPFFSPGIAFIANLCLTYILKVTHFFASWSLASVEVSHGFLWSAILSGLAVVVWGVAVLRRWKTKREC